jgi:hypothetical protein
MSRITYYHILGVSSDATEDEITGAFRRKVKQWHPDICTHPDAEERMREINEAAEILCDPERRARYDRALAGKDPLESPAAVRTDKHGKSGWSWFPSARGFGKGHPPYPFTIGKEALRFVVTGGAALVIFGILLVAAWTAVPFLSAPAGSPASGGLPEQPVLSLSLTADTGQLKDDGDQRLNEGDYRGALAAYDAIIAQNPEIRERDIWYNRGIAQNALGLYTDASDSFDRALSISPEDSFALAQKGAALIGLKKYEESLQYTDRALNQGSDTGWIWNNRGIALESLGQNKEARIAFENAGIFSGQQGSELYRTIVVQPVSLTGF